MVENSLTDVLRGRVLTDVIARECEDEGIDMSERRPEFYRAFLCFDSDYWCELSPDVEIFVPRLLTVRDIPGESMEVPQCGMLKEKYRGDRVESIMCSNVTKQLIIVLASGECLMAEHEPDGTSIWGEQLKQRKFNLPWFGDSLTVV